MKQGQKQEKRNKIVFQLIAIIQQYDYTYGDCFFDDEVQMGVVSFCCDMVSRNVIREMEEIGLKIYHIYFSNYENCYKISFQYQYHD